jgi:hypothetical protein
MLVLGRCAFLENSGKFLHVRHILLKMMHTLHVATACFNLFNSTLNPICTRQSPTAQEEHKAKTEDGTSEYKICFRRSSLAIISLAVGVPALREVFDVLRWSSATPAVSGRSSSKRGDSRPLPPADGGTGVARDLRGRFSNSSSSDDISPLASKAKTRTGGEGVSHEGTGPDSAAREGEAKMEEKEKTALS